METHYINRAFNNGCEILKMYNTYILPLVCRHTHFHDQTGMYARGQNKRMVLRWCSFRTALSISPFLKEKIHAQAFISQIVYPDVFCFVVDTQPHPMQQTKCSIDAALLTWCYQSRWCEKASPVRPRSACHQRRKPETRPETVYRHLQEHTEKQQAQNVKLFPAESLYVT